jgi:hypothetical protein
MCGWVGEVVVMNAVGGAVDQLTAFMGADMWSVGCCVNVCSRAHFGAEKGVEVVFSAVFATSLWQ